MRLVDEVNFLLRKIKEQSNILRLEVKEIGKSSPLFKEVATADLVVGSYRIPVVIKLWNEGYVTVSCEEPSKYGLDVFIDADGNVYDVNKRKIGKLKKNEFNSLDEAVKYINNYLKTLSVDLNSFIKSKVNGREIIKGLKSNDLKELQQFMKNLGIKNVDQLGNLADILKVKDGRSLLSKLGSLNDSQLTVLKKMLQRR